MAEFPKHFDGQRFFNPGAPQARGPFDALKWKLKTRPEPSHFMDDVQPSRPPADSSQIRVTLINHSTVLLQQAGLNILTDPIWSERASPLQWIGPKRLRHPGVRWDDLPRIDIALISHNHYDHLDLATLRLLAKRDSPRFIVPLGLARLLEKNGISRVQELDWGDSLPLERTTIHSVPAMHFSARGPFDRNRTLWCGYVLETPGGIIYFAADTGFGDHFAQIRGRFGPPRLALLPIGAYEPRWFMGPIHMAPEQAVQAHRILNAQTSIAIHHGTFQMADDGLDTPKKILAACAPGDSFLTLDNGESLTLAP